MLLSERTMASASVFFLVALFVVSVIGVLVGLPVAAYLPVGLVVGVMVFRVMLKRDEET